MPVYEFSCKKCGHVFDEMHSMKAVLDGVYCPLCKGEAVKIPSLSNFHLKGSGWYKDGYSKGKK